MGRSARIRSQRIRRAKKSGNFAKRLQARREEENRRAEFLVAQKALRLASISTKSLEKLVKGPMPKVRGRDTKAQVSSK